MARSTLALLVLRGGLELRRGGPRAAGIVYSGSPEFFNAEGLFGVPGLRTPKKVYLVECIIPENFDRARRAFLMSFGKTNLIAVRDKVFIIQ